MGSIRGVQMPSPAPFTGWAKWKQALPLLGIAAGAALYVVIIAVAVPRDVTAMWVLAGYTFLAGLVCLGVALALLLARQLPTARETVLDGQPAVLLRAWRGTWWFDLFLDTGIGALGLTLGVLGLLEGGEWVPWSVLALLAGAWFLARPILAMLGRRHNEALWVSAEEVVHDTSWGRERCRRSDIDRVIRLLDSSTLIIVVDGQITRELCPRPWRPRPRKRMDNIAVDCSLMGHDTGELIAWLQEGLPTRR